jgi:hypothetical protein
MNEMLLRRRGWAFAVGAVVAVAAAIIDLVNTSSPLDAVKTLIGAAIAVAVAGLALTLPGITRRGAIIGALFALAGVLTWTSTSRPIFIWGVLAIEGVLFAWWGRPWLPRLRDLSRLAGAWLGLPYWLLGVVGAVLVGHVTVAGERVAYAGVFTLAAMAVVASVRRRRAQGGADLTVGLAAAILVAVAVLLLAGSGTMFDAMHTVPNNGGAQLMRDRFWGGSGLFFQPNALAGLAVVVAMRIAPDRAFAWWQRLAVAAVGCFVLELTGSRTTWGFALIAALVHAAMVWRWRRGDLPTYRRPWVAAVTPLVLLGLVLVISGGSDFLIKDRFKAVPPPASATAPDNGDTLSAFLSRVTSGRTETWGQVVSDWRNASVAEKIFGDARTSRAVVTRANDPGVQLNTDNAAVGSFRRGGLLGLVAFLFGMVLLVVRAVRYRSAGGAPPAAWFTIFALAVTPTILFEDWVLGGTNGGIWLLLLAGEAFLLWSPAVKQPPEPLVSVGSGGSPVDPGGPDGEVTAATEQPVQASVPGRG